MSEDKINPEPIKLIQTRPDGRKRVATVFQGETMTQQQFQEQVNVNNIMKKYKQTGTITHIRNAQQGVYADMASLPSYQEAMQTIVNANAAFEEVPAHIRQRFSHDPHQFMQFLANPQNDEEAIKLGLKIRRPAPKPDPVIETLNTIAKNTAPKKAKITEEA